MAKAVAPRLRVVLDNDEEYTVQTDNRDLIRFDMLRDRMKWPDMQSAPMLWMTVLAWSCLAREGKLNATGVEIELDRIREVDVLNADDEVTDLSDEAALTVDPTQPAT